MPVLAKPVSNKAYVKGCYKRTLTGTTANVYANKPHEVTAKFDELEDRIKRHDAVLQREDYDVWVSKFRKLKQFMWDDMDRIDRGFVYVAFAYAVVCFVIFY